MCVSGGFARSFNAALRNVVDKADTAGSGASTRPWRRLITGYPDSDLTHDDPRKLWSIGREIASADVAEFLPSR